MDRAELLRVAKGLGLEFQRRHMQSQLRCLRDFSAAQKRSRKARAPGSWSTEIVLNWAALLKVPPMDKLYPAHPPTLVCPHCASATAVLRVEISWTDRALLCCQTCSFKWLRLH